jgi:hypothetical protein
MFQNTFWLLVDGALAFLVSLGFRSKEYPTFREWWTEEGMSIWLTFGAILSILLVVLSG